MVRTTNVIFGGDIQEEAFRQGTEVTHGLGPRGEHAVDAEDDVGLGGLSLQCYLVECLPGAPKGEIFRFDLKRVPCLLSEERAKGSWAGERVVGVDVEGRRDREGCITDQRQKNGERNRS